MADPSSMIISNLYGKQKNKKHLPLKKSNKQGKYFSKCKNTQNFPILKSSMAKKIFSKILSWLIINLIYRQVPLSTVPKKIADPDLY